MINLALLFEKAYVSMAFLSKLRKEEPKIFGSNTSAVLSVDLEQREMLLLSKCVVPSAFSLPLESA